MQGFEQFEGNPFTSILSSMGAQQTQTPMRNGGAQQEGTHQMPNGQMMKNSEMMEDDNQLVKGKGAGATPFLMSAVQSLQKFVTQSTEPSDIAAARSIISLISKLINKDQERMTQRLQQDSEMMQTA